MTSPASESDTTLPTAELPRETIRRICLANGFTIKDNDTRDLKPYVYAAVEECAREAVRLDRGARAGSVPAEKIAPVQGYTPGIPWSLHLEAYDAYSKKWAPQQALVEGGCRGGFSTDELDDFIPGWRDRVSEIGRLRARVAELERTPPDEATSRDAQRYRWLRDKSVPPHNFYISVPVEFDGVHYTPAEVDAAIDAARAHQEQS